ncbi:hypothetical protein AAHB49_06450 [Bacillus cereus]
MMTYSCLHGMIMKKLKQYRKNMVCTKEEKTMVSQSEEGNRNS